MNDAIETLKMTSRVLVNCDAAKRDIQSYPEDQRRNWLARVERIRTSARTLADRCLDGIQGRGEHDDYMQKSQGLMNALSAIDEPVQIDPECTVAHLETMYAQLLAVIHLGGPALTPAQFSSGVGVLTELANLIECLESGDCDDEELIEDFCEYAEPIFEGLEIVLTGGSDE